MQITNVCVSAQNKQKVSADDETSDFEPQLFHPSQVEPGGLDTFPRTHQPSPVRLPNYNMVPAPLYDYYVHRQLKVVSGAIQTLTDSTSS